MFKCNLFCDQSWISASLLQSSVSHDPSEIILICWFPPILKILVLLNSFMETMIHFYISDIKNNQSRLCKVNARWQCFQGPIEHICKNLMSDVILWFPRTEHVDRFIREKLNVYERTKNVTWYSKHKNKFTSCATCHGPALYRVDIKDQDKGPLFQFNYGISQLQGFTRPWHFQLTNKSLTNLNSSAMTHPALTLQFHGKRQKLKLHVT